MKMLARITATILSGAMLASATSPVQQAGSPGGVVISPVMFRTEVVPGSSYTLPVDISNLGAVDLDVRVLLSSVAYNEWSYTGVQGASNERDCSKWFAKTAFQMALKPRKDGTCKLELRVPKVKAGCYYCTASVTPRVPNRNDMITASYEIPIILLVGKQPKAEIKLGSPVLDGTPENPIIKVPFENAGDGFTVIGTNVALTNLSTGRVVGRFADSDRNLYPHTKRWLTFGGPALDGGVYAVSVGNESGTRKYPKLVSQAKVAKNKITMARAGETFELAPITLEPGLMSLDLTKGGSRSSVLRVRNTSKDAISLQLKAGRLTQAKSGAFEVVPDDNQQDVLLDPAVVTVGAGRSASVKVKVSAKPGAVGDQWYGISVFASSLKNSIPEDVYLRVINKAGTPSLHMTSLGLDWSKGRPLSLKFTVQNDGTMALRPIVSASVMSRGVDVIAQLQVPQIGDGGILPGSTLENIVQLPANLLPGSYAVVVQYQFGDELFERLNIPFQIAPPKPEVKKK